MNWCCFASFVFWSWCLFVPLRVCVFVVRIFVFVVLRVGGVVFLCVIAFAYLLLLLFRMCSCFGCSCFFGVFFVFLWF